MRAVVHALVASLPEASLRSDVAVRGLERRSEWRVYLADGTDVDATVVLLATPPRVIAGLVGEIDLNLSALFSRVRAVSLLTEASVQTRPMKISAALRNSSHRHSRPAGDMRKTSAILNVPKKLQVA